MMDDKQAREKERIANDLCQWCEGYTVKEIFSEALQEYANFCLRENLIRSVEIAAEKDERIESLSAQVAALTKERDQYLHELEDAENQITGYWSRQKQRAEAAEVQVAELREQCAKVAEAGAGESQAAKLVNCEITARNIAARIRALSFDAAKESGVSP